MSLENFRIKSPLDLHVWFDNQIDCKWKILISREKITSPSSLCDFILNHTPWFCEIDILDFRKLVRKKIFRKVRAKADIMKFNFWPSTFDDMLIFLHENPRFLNEIDFPLDIPPHEIHRMQKSKHWIGDFYSADLIIDVLEQSKIKLSPNQHILDLGCSSGSLLRVLNWYLPTINWKGCDTVKKSIDWASNNLKRIEFFHISQTPPTNITESSLDGIISVSVWSHHSSNAAKLWFNEVRRILKSGGWFLFTTHGLNSLYYNSNNLDKPIERWISIYEGLLQSRSVFEQVWMTADETGNDASNWGNLYVKPEWIFEQLLEDFELLRYERGLNQKNQDVYLLKKK